MDRLRAASPEDILLRIRVPGESIRPAETIVYTGEFFDNDGVFSFAENIDDGVRIYIDGVLVLDDYNWNHVTTTAITDGLSSGANQANTNPSGGTVNFGMGANGDGWHTFEVRMANGGGGEGAVQRDGWLTTFGFCPCRSRFRINDRSSRSNGRIHGAKRRKCCLAIRAKLDAFSHAFDRYCRDY